MLDKGGVIAAFLFVTFMALLLFSCSDPPAKAELEEINSFVGWEIWTGGYGRLPLCYAMEAAGYKDLGTAWYVYHVPFDKAKIENGVLVITGRSGELYYISSVFYMKELR